MKIPILRSIKARLTLWFAIILALIFLVSDILLLESFKSNMDSTIDHTLFTAAEEAELIIFRTPPGEWQKAIKQIERGFLVNRLFIQILRVNPGDEDYLKIIARSGVLSGNISQKKVWQRLHSQLPKSPVYLNVNEESDLAHPFRIILYPVAEDLRSGYLIQVGTSLKKIQSLRDNLFTILIISAPLLLLLTVLGGYIILSRALTPVKNVVQTARRITTEDLSLRIESNNRKDEIGQLITTLNQMIARLDHSVQQIKKISSDASHDLKTPITVIRGEIEIALRNERSKEEYKNTLVSVAEEARKMDQLINNLLFLSRIEARQHPLPKKSIQLDEILLEAFEKTQQLAISKGLRYIITQMDTVLIQGDAVMIKRLMVNLFDNAIKYTPPAGEVRISLIKKGEQIVLEIKDTGIGIPEEDLSRIFDRFYRVDQSRSQEIEGSGLGLSIVKKISELHNARIMVTSMKDRGTTFNILFQ